MSPKTDNHWRAAAFSHACRFSSLIWRFLGNKCLPKKRKCNEKQWFVPARDSLSETVSGSLLSAACEQRAVSKEQ